MSHVCSHQHMVFRTYKSRKSMPCLSKPMMLKHIERYCIDKGMHYKNANIHRNHVHLLLGIPTTMSLEQVVTGIKGNASKAFKGHRLFPGFQGWAQKHGSFSVSYAHLRTVSGYVNNQEKHHEAAAFYEESKRLAGRNGCMINDCFEQDFGKGDAEEECL